MLTPEAVGLDVTRVRRPRKAEVDLRKLGLHGGAQRRLLALIADGQRDQVEPAFFQAFQQGGGIGPVRR